MKVYSINGYWKDNKDEFEDFLVSEFHDVPAGYMDSEIFFFGLGEHHLKDAIAKGENTVHDFVITDYEEVK